MCVSFTVYLSKLCYLAATLAKLLSHICWEINVSQL